MRVSLLSWAAEKGWALPAALPDAQWVIYFGGRAVLEQGNCYQELRDHFPHAEILGGSTGGEIWGSDVRDGTVVAAAVQFDQTHVRATSVEVVSAEDSYHAGQQLGMQLAAPDLRYVFLLSDGLHVNGSELIQGLYHVLPASVVVTGGLAGDGADFKQSFVGLNTRPKEKQIAAIGFYGAALRVHYGSVGGWKPFGPERKITRSHKNILYQLDGLPALDLYKSYLGEDAERLPSSALLFPLSIHAESSPDHAIVRTIVGIDEAEKSLIFAGDIPEGHIAQLMRGDFHDLADGAGAAAHLALPKQEKEAEQEEGYGKSLALLVSCIGRKLLMGQTVMDETESVAEVLGANLPTIGFYSYGEISPQQFTHRCSLHNQTMTITVLDEC